MVMFNTGDKVKCISPSIFKEHAGNVGEIYIVENCNVSGFDIYDKNGRLWKGNSLSRFRLYIDSLICSDCRFECKQEGISKCNFKEVIA